MNISTWPAAPAAVFALLCGMCPAALAAFSPDTGAPGEPVCSARYHAPPSAFADVVGTYRLSNGDLLRVRREVARYVADIGRVGSIEILALGDDSFAEKGGPLRFSFSHEAFDDRVVVTGLDRPRPGPHVCAG